MNDIWDVEVQDVKIIPDERGRVIKIPMPPNLFHVRDVYCTTINYGAIKAWHGYETKQLWYCAIKGMVKLVLCDMRKESPTYLKTMEVCMGEHAVKAVLVPHGVYNGFKGISFEEAVVVVQADEPYGQIYRLPYDTPEIPYDWLSGKYG